MLQQQWQVLRPPQSSTGSVTAASSIPANAYLAEDGITPYVAEDGVTVYVDET
jgi:hypothetical protein